MSLAHEMYLKAKQSGGVDKTYREVIHSIDEMATNGLVAGFVHVPTAHFDRVTKLLQKDKFIVFAAINYSTDGITMLDVQWLHADEE